MPLTDTAIKRLKPTDKCTPARPDKYSDGDGLRLWVRHTGNKVWVSDYKFNGKRQSLTLGKYPILSLAQARQKHQHVRQMIAQGTDPKQHKKEQKAKVDGSLLFDNIAQEWYAERKTYLAKKTYDRNYSAYERDVKPAIGHMIITDIAPPDILAIGKAIEKRGAIEMSKRTIREVGQIFKHAIRQGLATHNPAINLTEAIQPSITKHHNRITIRQLPQLLQDIDNYKGHVLVKLGLWFTCYTFLRTNEVRMLEWADIDFKDKIIRLSAEKMKVKRKHLVPLAPPVIELLQQIKGLGFSEKYVFYNTSKRQPLSSHAFINALYKMGYKGKMTTHGFRGLASTTLHELEYMHEAIELQLAHDKDNKVSKAYDGAMYIKYRTKMMNDWAKIIDNAKLGTLDNVIHVDFKSDTGKSINQ
ncbi:integrase arm-type DNA-binding domain-containing protein [Psychrobacter sp. HD31]|uniref:tyrosine-type recombinase/integrase n=1 Tax=Psychrobacter sp. HD31 TaxID=3112003 RepID=UPI003DA2430F